MKALFCIPHFYDHSRKAHDVMGSSVDLPEVRSEHVKIALRSVIALCSNETFFIGGVDEDGTGNSHVAVERTSNSNSVVVCFNEKYSIISSISSGRVIKHFSSDQDPRLLGYVCRTIFAEHQNDYDIFCFIEDDTAIYDPLFLTKIENFYYDFGEQRIVQPNRYEIFGKQDLAVKVYLDTPVIGKLEIDDVLNDEAASLETRDQNLLVRSNSKMSGVYCITRAQLKTWMRSAEFIRPNPASLTNMDVMEAAQLPLGGRYPTFRPAKRNPEYLEVHHVPNRACFARTPRSKIIALLKETSPAKFT